MGNICGKSSVPDSDNFARPGRLLADPPQQPSNPTASLPKNKIAGRSQTQPSPAAGTISQDEARRKAAAAAEARANAANKPKGKLGSALQDQKKQTQTDTLNSAARDNLRMREADQAAESRAYN